MNLKDIFKQPPEALFKGVELLAMLEKGKRGEITIHSMATTKKNGEYKLVWSQKNKNDLTV